MGALLFPLDLRTLGCWIKDNLKVTGIDTGQFTAHSTRNASTSCAQSKGDPINDIFKVHSRNFIIELKVPHPY